MCTERMAPRTEVNDAERRQLQKLWAENPVRNSDP
eukprot:COSAG02_NODE_58288_length_278_cov_0.497207_2_plen_34_part_01